MLADEVLKIGRWVAVDTGDNGFSPFAQALEALQSVFIPEGDDIIIADDLGIA